MRRKIVKASKIKTRARSLPLKTLSRAPRRLEKKTFAERAFDRDIICINASVYSYLPFRISNTPVTISLYFVPVMTSF